MRSISALRLSERLERHQASSEDVREQFKALVEECRAALSSSVEENDWLRAIRADRLDKRLQAASIPYIVNSPAGMRSLFNWSRRALLSLSCESKPTVSPPAQTGSSWLSAPRPPASPSRSCRSRRQPTGMDSQIRSAAHESRKSTRAGASATSRPNATSISGSTAFMFRPGWKTMRSACWSLLAPHRRARRSWSASPTACGQAHDLGRSCSSTSSVVGYRWAPSSRLPMARSASGKPSKRYGHARAASAAGCTLTSRQLPLGNRMRQKQAHTLFACLRVPPRRSPPLSSSSHAGRHLFGSF